MSETPHWSVEMAEIFKGGSISQFILHGNVDDWVSYRAPGSAQIDFFTLRDFLHRVMFEPFEVVLSYDRGRGIRVLKGSEPFFYFLKTFDDFHRTGFISGGKSADPRTTLDMGNALPKEPKRALALIDRFIRNGLQRMRPGQDGRPVAEPMRIAVVLEYAQFLAPRTEIGYASAESIETMIRILDWAADPTIASSYICTCLIAENLADIAGQIVENPRAAKIQIKLPNAQEVLDYITSITTEIKDFSTVCDLDRVSLGQKLEGLSRIDIQNLIERAVKNNRRISMEYLRKVKKEMIEKSAGGRIEFVESTRSLDHVASHVEAKAWLRQDAELMKKGKLKALPMGYLICGRIGTGKTYLVECFAGEAGVPCVELKNFRDKWVGATEGNLEAIFKILHAMGQVIVFVDEADQIAGSRSSGAGDSGVSGRIYGMLAREMADTRNRGRIFWVFATSRPDLLEVDLKRVGRLDVHIPLFSPQTQQDREDLFLALAKKNDVQITREDIPEFPADMDIGGNEMEGILIMASRLFEVQAAAMESGQPGAAEEKGTDKTIGHFLRQAMTAYRPMAHAERLEFMDLAAVLECTDRRFLPPLYVEAELGTVKRRMEELKARLNEL